MTQRTLAGLWPCRCWSRCRWTAFRPLPYVIYEPGSTIDVLGETDGKEIIQVVGHSPTATHGQLRMTTVWSPSRDARLDLFELMADWLNPDDGVYPYDAVYAAGRDRRSENREEGQSRWSPPRTPPRRSR